MDTTQIINHSLKFIKNKRAILIEVALFNID